MDLPSFWLGNSEQKSTWSKLVEKGYLWSPFVRISSTDIHLSRSENTKSEKHVKLMHDNLNGSDLT